MPKPGAKSDQEWRQNLTPEQYAVLRQKGTEAPFSGKLLYNQDKGVYVCAGCATPIFSSDTKYESTNFGLAGWPSFGDVVDKGNVELVEDNSWGMHRTAVVCKTCRGHLGHLFDDAASPTGKHYCINSCALDFKPGELTK